MIVSMKTTHEFICYFDQKLILIPKFIDVKKVYCLFLEDFNDQYKSRNFFGTGSVPFKMYYLLIHTGPKGQNA